MGLVTRAPGQICVRDVERGQAGEAGGQGAQVEAAEVVRGQFQGLQLSQALEDDVLTGVRPVQGTSNVT